jgi:hypothetical protein
VKVESRDDGSFDRSTRFIFSAFFQTKEVPHVSDGNKVISGFARIIFSSSGIG